MLERALADGAAGGANPLDALKRARKIWLSGRDLDMGMLAAELTISRATLYRWVGNRERLLVEVLWTLARDTWQSALAAAGRRRSISRVLFVLERYLRDISSSEALGAFVRRDPELALRVLTGPRGAGVRTQALVRELLEELVATTDQPLALEPDTMAYLIVKVAESFLYRGPLTGTPWEFEADTAIAIMGQLLAAQPAKRATSRRQPRVVTRAIGVRTTRG